MRTLILPLHSYGMAAMGFFGWRAEYQPVALLDGPLAPDAPCAQPVYACAVVGAPDRFEVRDALDAERPVVGYYEWIDYSAGQWCYEWREVRRRPGRPLEPWSPVAERRAA
jgi:hypothetical protein